MTVAECEAKYPVGTAVRRKNPNHYKSKHLPAFGTITRYPKIYPRNAERRVAYFYVQCPGMAKQHLGYLCNWQPYDPSTGQDLL